MTVAADLPRTMPRPPARAGWWLGVPVAAAAALAAWDPARRGGPTLCPLQALTGHTCPGCGLTRAAGALVRGRGTEALQLHPMVPVLAAQVLLGALAMAFAGAWVRRHVPGWVLPVVLALNAVALVMTWIVRHATGQIAVLG